MASKMALDATLSSKTQKCMVMKRNSAEKFSVPLTSITKNSLVTLSMTALSITAVF